MRRIYPLSLSALILAATLSPLCSAHAALSDRARVIAREIEAGKWQPDEIAARSRELAPGEPAALVAFWYVANVDVVDPFGHVQHTMRWDPGLHTYVPGGYEKPLKTIGDAINTAIAEAPDLRSDVADLVMRGIDGWFSHYAASKMSLVLSDWVLFSHHGPSPRTRADLSGGLFSLHGVPYEKFASSPGATAYFRKSENLRILQWIGQANPHFLVSGIWPDLANYAVELDSRVLERWRTALLRASDRFTANGQYSSALYVRHVGKAEGGFEFLAREITRVRGDTHTKNLLIAFVYFVESAYDRRGPRAKRAEYRSLWTSFERIAPDDELAIAKATLEAPRQK